MCLDTFLVMWRTLCMWLLLGVLFIVGWWRVVIWNFVDEVALMVVDLHKSGYRLCRVWRSVKRFVMQTAALR